MLLYIEKLIYLHAHHISIHWHIIDKIKACVTINEFILSLSHTHIHSLSPSLSLSFFSSLSLSFPNLASCLFLPLFRSIYSPLPPSPILSLFLCRSLYLSRYISPRPLTLPTLSGSTSLSPSAPIPHPDRHISHQRVPSSPLPNPAHPLIRDSNVTEPNQSSRLAFHNKIPNIGYISTTLPRGPLCQRHEFFSVDPSPLQKTHTLITPLRPTKDRLQTEHKKCYHDD